jgi:hypothetical protein
MLRDVSYQPVARVRPDEDVWVLWQLLGALAAELEYSGQLSTAKWNRTLSRVRTSAPGQLRNAARRG